LLYLKLALATGIPYGLVMALVTGATDSLGDYVGSALLFGVPFGVLMALVIGTLHRRATRKWRQE
jgi:hypothetical protein